MLAGALNEDRVTAIANMDAAATEIAETMNRPWIEKIANGTRILADRPSEILKSRPDFPFARAFILAASINKKAGN